MENTASAATTETPSVPMGKIVPPAGYTSELETLRKNVDMFNWLKNNIKEDVMGEVYASRRNSLDVIMSGNPCRPARVESSSRSGGGTDFFDVLTYVVLGAVWGIVVYKLVQDQKNKRAGYPSV